jgi:hypothetical protein
VWIEPTGHAGVRGGHGALDVIKVSVALEDPPIGRQ